MPFRLPVGEWLPDLPPNENPGALQAKNCIAQINSYTPFPSLTTFSTSLGSRALGAIIARDAAANVYTYAGDVSALYALNTQSWSNISRTVGGPYAVPDGDYWEFVQWGETVIAVNGVAGDAPQQISLGAASFAALSGAPPKARHIAVVRDFVVLGNLENALPQRVRWSAINNATSWTANPATLADFQDLPGDGGWIQKVVGGDYGVIIQERAVFRMDFVGSPLIFQFNQVLRNIGTPIPNSVVSYRDLVFFLSEDGFYVFDGSQAHPIGENRVDRTIRAALDDGHADRVSAIIDPARKLVAWAYPASGNIGGNPNRIAIYNWGAKRWSQIEDINIELLAHSISGGFTLDGLDAVSSSIDALTPTLDSRDWVGNEVLLSAFNANHRLSLFNGSAMPAVVDTNERMLFPDERTTITEIWPLVEAQSMTASVAPVVRDLLTGTASAAAAAQPNSTGFVPLRSSARYHRFRIQTSGEFDHIHGVMVNAVREGKR